MEDVREKSMQMKGPDLNIQHLNNSLPGREDTEMRNIKEVYSREQTRSKDISVTGCA